MNRLARSGWLVDTATYSITDITSQRVLYGEQVSAAQNAVAEHLRNLCGKRGRQRTVDATRRSDGTQWLRWRFS